MLFVKIHILVKLVAQELILNKLEKKVFVKNLTAWKEDLNVLKVVLRIVSMVTSGWR